MAIREESLWDRRNWEFALKTEKPQETYNEIADRMEDALDPVRSISIDSHPLRDWLRSV